MAKIIPIGTPRNDAERQAIAYLRDHLPSDCTVIHNFELEKDREIFEIDQVILTPHCVYVVDVKGIRGTVDVYSARWHPQGRAPYASPLAKARHIARLLKALILDAHPALLDMRDVYVRAAILLTAPDVKVNIHSDTDRYDVVLLTKSPSYFQNKAYIPARKSRKSHEFIDIRPLLPLIESAIRSRARPMSEKLIYGNWQVDDELGGNERFTEYRAHHRLAGKSGTARLRVYHADPYQDEATRRREQKIISNAFRAIINIPGHPNILNAREFIESEDGSYFVLVTEDVVGQTLGESIKKASLTFDQKLHAIRDVLTALDHSHKHHVLHRNITPDTIILSASARACLFSFEYARAEASSTSSIAQDIKEWVDRSYQAPECYGDPSKATIASDLFSAGLVFYELLTVEPAFTGPTQVYDSWALFPFKPTERNPDLPPGLDNWLQKLCAFEPQNRFSTASVALEAFNLAITPTPAVPLVARAEDSVLTPSLVPDRGNLPEGYVLNERFIVQEKLGQGGFAVTYKVFDTTADIARVLKLVLKDHVSMYQRMRQEYQTLVKLPEHPYVVKVIWADRLVDGIPYIVFEYIDGKNVEDLVREKALSVEDAVQLGIQVSQGLQHLHDHGIYHQDIKPSNLLFTEKGVRIIDFNVAVSEQDDIDTAGGTGRYIPPRPRRHLKSG